MPPKKLLAKNKKDAEPKPLVPPPPVVEILPESSKEYYLLQIHELEDRVTRYQKKWDEVVVQDQLRRHKADQMVKDRDDIIKYLEKELRERKLEIEDVNSEKDSAQDKADAELQELREKLYHLRIEFQDTKDQMTAEQKMFGRKLADLEEFREKKEELEAKTLDLEQKFESMQGKHIEELYLNDKKHVIDILRLKRDALARVNHMAREYRKAVDKKISNQAKNLLCENVSLHHELDAVSDKSVQLLAENEQSRKNETQMKLRVGMMEAMEKEWAKRLSSNNSIIEKLTAKSNEQMVLLDECRLQLEQLSAGCAACNDKTQQLNEALATGQKLQVEVDRLKELNADLTVQLEQMTSSRDQLQKTIDDVSGVLKSALELRPTEDCRESSMEAASLRSAVLLQIFALLSTDRDSSQTAKEAWETVELPATPPARPIIRDQPQRPATAVTRLSRPATVRSASSSRQRRSPIVLLSPARPLSSLRSYTPGDVGFVPRQRERLCTSTDTVRWLSASLNYQMIGRKISRSVATQTPML